MNSCVVYFYKSNKNYFKEDYESAYICSYLKKFGNSDVFLYSPATPLALNTKYDLYFIKIYEKEQLSDLYLFIKQNSISVSTIFFYGQYCRNNYELFLGYFSSCGGLIVEDEYDTIGGFLIGQIGRIPEDGEQPKVSFGGYTFKPYFYRKNT